MQPQKIRCSNCGAELLPEGRFCRKCGQPSNPLGRTTSVTEETTRRLGTPVDPFMRQGVPGQQSSLEASQRGQTVPGLSAQTRSLEPAKPLKRWLPALLLLALAVLLPAIYLLWQWRPSTATIPVPPAAGPAVAQPPRPPQPPTVPPPTGAPASAPIDQSLIFPNARTTMSVSKKGEGHVVQLETEEPVDRVVEWYKDRLKPTEIIQRPGNVILKSNEATAIINSSGNLTKIMLTQGVD